MGHGLKSAEIKGDGKNFGKSNLEGYTCRFWANTKSEEPIKGLVTVPSHFGKIEFSILLIIDSNSHQIARVPVEGHKLNDRTEFEFTLAQEFIKNSQFLIFRRDSGTQYLGRYHLGTFDINASKWIE